jgi:hypothetical protein
MPTHRGSRSSIYDPPLVAHDDTALSEATTAICGEFEAYRRRRVHAARRQMGLVVNHEKERRLMCEHDLLPKQRRRHGWSVAELRERHLAAVFGLMTSRMATPLRPT